MLIRQPDKTSNATSGFSNGKGQTQYRDQANTAFKVRSTPRAPG